MSEETDQQQIPADEPAPIVEKAPEPEALPNAYFHPVAAPVEIGPSGTSFGAPATWSST